MEPLILLAVPNVSEGRDGAVVEAIGASFAGGANSRETGVAGAGESTPPSGESRGELRLLDVHSDGDHHRSVFTLAGRPGQLADAVLRGAARAVDLIDVMNRPWRDAMGAPARQAELGRGEERPGQHPYVGAIDVAPIVYLDSQTRGAACAEALVVADRIGAELGVPVFLYGELAGDRNVTRAELRRGGPARLAERMSGSGRPSDAQRKGSVSRAAGALRADFGPPRLHPTAGATLVAAREPLVAFNLKLSSPATVAEARAIAALIREQGAEGLPGVRAIGVALGDGAGQVSMNVERPLEVPLAVVLEAARRHARVASAEIVGLAPRAAFDGFPADVPLPGFDPARQLIENALVA